MELKGWKGRKLWKSEVKNGYKTKIKEWEKAEKKTLKWKKKQIKKYR